MLNTILKKIEFSIFSGLMVEEVWKVSCLFQHCSKKKHHMCNIQDFCRLLPLMLQVPLLINVISHYLKCNQKFKTSKTGYTLCWSSRLWGRWGSSSRLWGCWRWGSSSSRFRGCWGWGGSSSRLWGRCWWIVGLGWPRGTETDNSQSNLPHLRIKSGIN